MKVLMIQRAEVFSPNSVDKDLAILTVVADRLRKTGCDIEMVSESKLLDSYSVAELKAYGTIFTMSRMPEVLTWLCQLPLKIINSPKGIALCSRDTVERTMDELHIPQAPQEGSDGYWLKRADAAAQSKDDVVFVPNRQHLQAAISQMRGRGVENYTVRAHVKGDLVKFYGVRHTPFFRYYYPTDEGRSKYGDEQHNGVARHYDFSIESLRTQVERLAAAIGILVYGGDCIVREDGSFCVIDFNDWPSFSLCREEAADAIVSLVDNKQ